MTSSKVTAVHSFFEGGPINIYSDKMILLFIYKALRTQAKGCMNAAALGSCFFFLYHCGVIGLSNPQPIFIPRGHS